MRVYEKLAYLSHYHVDIPSYHDVINFAFPGDVGIQKVHVCSAHYTTILLAVFCRKVLANGTFEDIEVKVVVTAGLLGMQVDFCDYFFGMSTVRERLITGLMMEYCQTSAPAAQSLNTKDSGNE